jgi:protein-disulfide isomerase
VARVALPLSSGAAPLAAPTKSRDPASTDPAQLHDEPPLRDRRQRRLRRTVGLVLIVVAFVAVGIAISRKSGAAPPKPGSPQARRDVAAVNRLLAGVPQSGVRLGSARAPVTVTEIADLECSFCREFALGAERQLISNQVREGRVKVVYRSLCTATCTGPLGRAGFTGQQAAAYAAGIQNRGWAYIQLFYEEQGSEGSSYVTPRYLDGLARQLPGLDYRRWRSDKGLPQLKGQVATEERAAKAQGFGTTPTIIVRGPRGTAKPIVGEASYAQLRAAINSVQ